MWGGRQTLCAVLLLSVTLQPAARNLCSNDIIASVNTVIQEMRNQENLDTKLYTPTITDFRKCPKSTMTCFAKEAKVLEEEAKNITKLNKRLEKMARLLKQPQLDCPQCELHTENTTTEFLRDLRKVLQANRVERCPETQSAGG